MSNDQFKVLLDKYFAAVVRLHSERSNEATLMQWMKAENDVVNAFKLEKSNNEQK